MSHLNSQRGASSGVLASPSLLGLHLVPSHLRVFSEVRMGPGMCRKNIAKQVLQVVPTVLPQYQWDQVFIRTQHFELDKVDKSELWIFCEFATEAQAAWFVDVFTSTTPVSLHTLSIKNPPPLPFSSTVPPLASDMLTFFNAQCSTTPHLYSEELYFRHAPHHPTTSIVTNAFELLRYEFFFYLSPEVSPSGAWYYPPPDRVSDDVDLRPSTDLDTEERRGRLDCPQAWESLWASASMAVNWPLPGQTTCGAMRERKELLGLGLLIARSV
ncbi:hypothetical protein K438DRAFT_1977969 [Mycena galopus ATCC 62051]|nr:hypothetical protein K438DRAFT_1977969 [Mycena galopus ATCC 62051]